MRFKIDPDCAVGIAAVVALHEAGMSFEWGQRPASSRNSGPATACVSCTESDAWDGGARAISVHALLEMLFPSEAETTPLGTAQARTLTEVGLELLCGVATHRRGDPEAPLSGQIAGVFADLEQNFCGEVFVPERFSYVPAPYFSGHHMGQVDITYAALFAAAEPHFPVTALTARFPKVSAWRGALCERDSFKRALAEFSQATSRVMTAALG